MGSELSCLRNFPCSGPLASKAGNLRSRLGRRRSPTFSTRVEEESGFEGVRRLWSPGLFSRLLWNPTRPAVLTGSTERGETGVMAPFPAGMKRRRGNWNGRQRYREWPTLPARAASGAELVLAAESFSVITARRPRAATWPRPIARRRRRTANAHPGYHGCSRTCRGHDDPRCPGLHPPPPRTTNAKNISSALAAHRSADRASSQKLFFPDRNRNLGGLTYNRGSEPAPFPSLRIAPLCGSDQRHRDIRDRAAESLPGSRKHIEGTRFGKRGPTPPTDC